MATLTGVAQTQLTMERETKDYLLSRVQIVEKEVHTLRRQLVNLIVKYNELSYEQKMANRNRVGDRDAVAED